MHQYTDRQGAIITCTMFDNLEAFFHDPNFSKQFVGTLPPPAVVAEPAIPEQHAATAEENTTAYAQAYVEREIKALREVNWPQ